jgi:hypothetical protein
LKRFSNFLRPSSHLFEPISDYFEIRINVKNKQKSWNRLFSLAALSLAKFQLQVHVKILLVRFCNCCWHQGKHWIQGSFDKSSTDFNVCYPTKSAHGFYTLRSKIFYCRN